MKIFYLFLLFYSFGSSAQTATEKYNSYLKRYEYFDSNGYMTGYKQYNTYRNQWEYYKTENQAQQPTPSFDLELTRQVLSSKQKRYDYNNQRIQNEVKESVTFIYASSKMKGFTYEEGKRAVTEFDVYYVNKIRYGNYDLSYDSVADNLITFLAKGALKIACDNFKDCN